MSEEKRVKHLMRPLGHYQHVQEGATLAEALRFLAQTRNDGRPPLLLVVDEGPLSKGVVKGFATSRELVLGSVDHFLKGAQSSGPIFWEGQFETECRQGSSRLVSEVMMPIKGCVREGEMLLEAVFLLDKYQLEFLPVIDQDDVTGMIHLDDIMEELARVVLA